MCCENTMEAMPRMKSNKPTAHKAIALVLCAALILVSCLSPVFVFTHADHEHDHNGPDGTCATCAQMAAAGRVLKLLAVAAAVGLAIAFLRQIVRAQATMSVGRGCSSPVALKVRLNN